MRGLRRLTAGEIALAVEVFGAGLRLDTVRLMATPWPLTRAFVPGRWFGRDWVLWPRLPADLSVLDLRHQATLIHELVHVWQAQAGVSLIVAKLKAGDRPESYAYLADRSCVWDGLNIEQQAMVIEHRFRLSRGQAAPADAAFYSRLCPWAADD